MDRWVGKVAVVTGAGSGIGAAITEKLVEHGINVAGLDICKATLDQLDKKLTNSKGKFWSLAVDITNESEVVDGFEWIKEHLGPVHILVNCAGIARDNDLIDGDAQMWKDVLDTNVFGLCLATREAVKHMTSNEIKGHVIHINSISGHTVLPYSRTNVYCASKYAVTALTETLRREIVLKGLGIKVTSISPGLVSTNLYESAGFHPKAIKAIGNRPSLYPKDIADGVLYVLGTPPHVQVHELTIKPVGEID
ncbi:farnesol dehydrogenase-like [Agrilus planipennis]|uniref:Farnesol dehydrogenase-like n=1 Tax=Agrilus planipennis TaxID=224129 RepID=A0A7F5RNW8_AGRPL|nr:farnesol dehydrogenase-like [Agrilus planipennis]XP_025837719.1 farnesol dehydrogenase-like [Agrilus planipennis]